MLMYMRIRRISIIQAIEAVQKNIPAHRRETLR